MKLQAESLPFPRPPFPSKRGKSGNATVKFALSSVNRKWVPWRDCPHCCSKAGEGPGNSHLWSLDPTKKSHPPGPFPASSAAAAGAASTSQDLEAAGAPPVGDGVRTRSRGACTGLRGPAPASAARRRYGRCSRTASPLVFPSGMFRHQTN